MKKNQVGNVAFCFLWDVAMVYPWIAEFTIILWW